MSNVTQKAVQLVNDARVAEAEAKATSTAAAEQKGENK
jgi:hypothetical protein